VATAVLRQAALHLEVLQQGYQQAVSVQYRVPVQYRE
jgi:hypothetical protein